jgi:anti-anti-sigma factor
MYRSVPVIFASQMRLSARLLRALSDSRCALRAITQLSNSAVIVQAGGEVDAFNEHTWQRLISEAIDSATPPGPVVIDANGLHFIGGSAFAVLAAEAQRCRLRGVELRLVGREPKVARFVEACGLSNVLPVYPTTHAALHTKP